MKIKFSLIIFAMVFAVITSAADVANVGAVSSFVNYPNSQPSFSNYYSSSQAATYWPDLGDRESCQARQDIILQIAPAGCKPVVVTSDLLADQNVPVFCQVNAIKINPLLDIKEISNIRFSGSYPKEIVGTGFHPARAALRTENRLLGSPLLSNIGYIVVVLKRNEKEAELPDFINFTLGAQIEYESGNSLGVGKAEFKLKEISDSEWSAERIGQSFWNGQYYLRAEEVTPEKVSVSVYQGDRKIASRSLERGKTSDEIYVPGSYCRAALEMVYDGAEADQNSARIEVAGSKGTDYIEVYQGSSFLNGKCSVRKLNAVDSNIGDVEIRCGGAEIKLSSKARTNNGLEDSFIAKGGDEAFELAIEDYEKVADDFPAEKDNTGDVYGWKALDAAIKLAQYSGKGIVEERLLRKIVEKYPDLSAEHKVRLDSISAVDYSSAVESVKIDNDYKIISLRNFNIAKTKSSAKFLVGNNQFSIEPGKRENNAFGSGDYLELNILRADRAKISYKCSDGKSGSEEIELRESKTICSEQVTFESADIQNIAKVRVLPRAKGTETITNLSVSIGIEKRAIKLSPEKTKERIANLDKSIARWEKISNALTSTVKVMKTACFATSAVLTFKNLVAGLGGAALARQEVMGGEDGWTKWCADNKDTYGGSLNLCYQKNADKINADVEKTKNAIENVNEKIGGIQKKHPNSDSSDLLGDKSIDTEGAKKELAQFVRSEYGAVSITLKGGAWKNGDGTTASSVTINEVLSDANLDAMSYEEVRNLYMNLERNKIGGFSETGKAGVEGALSKNILSINSNVLADSSRRASEKNVDNGMEVSAGSYTNKYIEPEVKYYESEPYKGMPAIVPIDINNGWYAATKQTLPVFGGIGAFDASGRVVSFSLCNVGKNGRAEVNHGYGDDICQIINLNTGQPLGVFPGLEDSAYVKSLVDKGVRAINDASNQYGSKGRVSILGTDIKVGIPAVDIPSTQCQDFMSPNECQLLFNVCDPVICPRSRCDLGGAYPVADVVRTGIIGSTLLCLPNFNEGIYVPVCLTGINAGVDSYMSVLKSHRDCLNENLQSGKMVGFCDEHYSVYMCKLFWEQAAPITDVILPNLISRIFGQGARGGGEYLTVNDAWKKTENSIKYFTQEYGVNLFEAFKTKAVAEIGGEVCSAFISAKAPKSFEGLIEPRSPSQFSASFSSSRFSDATIPATSQYKVSYHIFAGKDDGVYYGVYLKTSEESSYYNIPAVLSVASGFIGLGEYASETRDFTAPEGYKELCVNINGEEKCGFKEVTTNFALDYLAGRYASGQAAQVNVDSESECISGSASAGALLTQGGLQGRAEEAVLPEIYNRGITRICSTQNPGSSTNPGRFVDVGHCGEAKLRCWLDSYSIKNSVSESNRLVKAESIAELEKATEENFEMDKFILNDEEAERKISAISEESNEFDKLPLAEAKKNIGFLVQRIDSIYGMMILDNQKDQKAKILLLKAGIRESLVRRIIIDADARAVPAVVNGGAPARASAASRTEMERTERERADTEIPVSNLEMGDWTLDSAISAFGANNIRLDWKYSAYKKFVDELYEDKIISEEEYIEIKGEGRINLEESMKYVRDLLLGKRIAAQRRAGSD